jgi:peptidoglycan/LPS O-acetylase OafA/YrhL
MHTNDILIDGATGNASVRGPIETKEFMRIVELDGMRGFAILLVVAAHYFGEVAHGLRWLALGWAGVDMFFVLSGFLIGSILLHNIGRKHYFRTFYIRRTFRIFPVYYIALALLFLLFLHGSDGLPVISYFTYTQNIMMAVSNHAGSSWLLPTWTLAVEEQFYLLLPAVIYFVPRRLLPGVIIAAILSAPLLRSLFLAMGDMGSYVLLPCRWDLLFIGVCAAYLNQKPIDLVWVKTVLLGSALIFVIAAVISATYNPAVFDVVGELFVGLCFGAFLLLVVTGSPEGQRFRSRTLRFFGSISYCLYLVHQPIAGIMHGYILGAQPDVANLQQVLVSITAVVVSVCVATLSWILLERPLIEFGHRWKYGGAQKESPVGATIAAS